jgi:hypothetical protein
MTALGNIFKGSLKAAVNPKDIKGNLTGGYTTSQKMQEDADKKRAVQTTSPTAPVSTEGRALTSDVDEEMKKDRLASQRLLG